MLSIARISKTSPNQTFRLHDNYERPRALPASPAYVDFRPSQPLFFGGSYELTHGSMMIHWGGKITHDIIMLIIHGV